MAGEIELFSRGRATHLLGHNKDGLPVRQRPAVSPHRSPSLLRWRGKLAAHKAGTLGRNLIIALHGDSTMAGEDQTSAPLNAQGINSPAGQLAVRLRARGYNAESNCMFSTQGSGSLATHKSKESRFDYAGAAALDPQIAIGGNGLGLSAAGSYSWTPARPVTKFRILWRDGGVGRNFNASIDGGAATAINSTGTVRYGSTIISAGAAGTHTLNLAWAAGAPTIYAIDAYDDTDGRTEISVWNWGTRGITSTGIINNPVGTPNAGTLNQMAFLAPDLIISNMGIINDWRAAGISVETSKANLRVYADAVNAAGIDMLFLAPPYDNGSNGQTANQDQYVNGMFDVADEKGLDVIDYRGSLGSWLAANAAGMMADDVHMRRVGYSDVADMIVETLRF